LVWAVGALAGRIRRLVRHAVPAGSGPRPGGMTPPGPGQETRGKNAGGRVFRLALATTGNPA
jgi:hypothetical protein